MSNETERSHHFQLIVQPLEEPPARIRRVALDDHHGYIQNDVFGRVIAIVKTTEHRVERGNHYDNKPPVVVPQDRLWALVAESKDDAIALLQQSLDTATHTANDRWQKLRELEDAKKTFDAKLAELTAERDHAVKLKKEIETISHQSSVRNRKLEEDLAKGEEALRREGVQRGAQQMTRTRIVNRRPPPDEVSLSVPIRQYRADRHVVVQNYKSCITLNIPIDAALWLDPDQADAIAAALRACARIQRKRDAWALKHEPKSYDADVARKRQRRRGIRNRRGRR